MRSPDCPNFDVNKQPLPNINKQPQERPMFLEQLEREIKGLSQREAGYYETARQADMVLVVNGCDDSRQGIPQGMQTINWQGQQKNVLFDFSPAIGSGVSRKTLPAVVDGLARNGVEEEKIIVVVAQHGNSEEVNKALNGEVSENPTCGLRGVLKKLELGQQVHVLPGLLKHAGEINKSSSIIANQAYVFEETKRIFEKSRVKVVGGYFDHEGHDENGKSMDLVDGLDSPISISLPEQIAWHERHQDPQALIVSFGRRAAALPDGVILQETVGMGANNDFNSAGVDEESFERAMREQWYALSHVGGHGEDLNFRNTSLMVILCDGERETGLAKKFMAGEEFKKEFSPFVAKLKDKGVYLVDLSKESVELAKI